MEQNEGQITLVAKDSAQVKVSYNIAEKIPAVKVLMRLKEKTCQQKDIIHVFGDTSKDLSAVEAFESGATLKAITNIVEEVYNHAPVLKRDPKFFKKTDVHPAYTPVNIPMQVRNIMYNMESAKRTMWIGLNKFLGFYSNQEKGKRDTCMQAADFLGLHWIIDACKNTESKSIADLIACNKLPRVTFFFGRLNLANNNLISLVGMHLIDSKTLASIQVLDLKGNQLQELQPGVFDRLHNLQDLFLTCNQLQELQPGVFDRLLSLQVLDLRGNQLQEVQLCIFDRLHNLQALSLACNQLQKLQPDLFDRLSNLILLELDKNKLQELPPGVFNGLHNLQALSLMFNQLQELQPKLFNRLRSLEDLWLDKYALNQKDKKRIQPRIKLILRAC
jgi:Leucine-rich repeat (LRR) protein